jgi:hypothetical protein
MKASPSKRDRTVAKQPKRKRTPRVAVARALDRERPTRVWSLLLPPAFPPDRK